MKIAGLFAGIGGIELGFHKALGEAVQTEMLCEWWEPAQAVLATRFPGVDLHPDVRELRPASEARRRDGRFPLHRPVAGRPDGRHRRRCSRVLSPRLRGASADAGDRAALPWLMIENVRTCSRSTRARRWRYLVDELEALGLPLGLPRRRLPLHRRAAAPAASDPAGIGRPSTRDRCSSPTTPASARDRPRRRRLRLLLDRGARRPRLGAGRRPDAQGRLDHRHPLAARHLDPGRRSAAASSRRLIEDAEEMQGFERGWTDVAGVSAERRAVAGSSSATPSRLGVAEWVAGRIADPGRPGRRPRRPAVEGTGGRLPPGERTEAPAGRRSRSSRAHAPYEHLPRAST